MLRCHCQDIEVAIFIQVCVSPGFDKDKLQEYGYSSIHHYFSGEKQAARRELIKQWWPGQSRHDQRRFGWSGHTNNGSKITNRTGSNFLFWNISKFCLNYLAIIFYSFRCVWKCGYFHSFIISTGKSVNQRQEIFEKEYLNWWYQFYVELNSVNIPPINFYD